MTLMNELLGRTSPEQIHWFPHCIFTDVARRRCWSIARSCSAKLVPLCLSLCFFCFEVGICDIELAESVGSRLAISRFPERRLRSKYRSSPLCRCDRSPSPSVISAKAKGVGKRRAWI
jgi:hypothetical protein